MRCDFCGTKVKVVGDIARFYEPMVDKDMLLSILDKFFNADKNHVVKDYVFYSNEKLADAIISAMYGED